MQITDREDLDGPLISPKLPRGTWHYDLVSQVQPGDRVLHWWTRGGAHLAGWSEVEEHATVIPEYTWTPRHGSPRTTPGWSARLGRVRPFSPSVTSADLLPLQRPQPSNLQATPEGTGPAAPLTWKAHENRGSGPVAGSHLVRLHVHRRCGFRRRCSARKPAFDEEDHVYDLRSRVEPGGGLPGREVERRLA